MRQEEITYLLLHFLLQIFQNTIAAVIYIMHSIYMLMFIYIHVILLSRVMQTQLKKENRFTCIYLHTYKTEE